MEANPCSEETGEEVSKGVKNTSHGKIPLGGVIEPLPNEIAKSKL